MRGEYEVNKINAIIEGLDNDNTLIQVTDWINGEGYDIIVTRRGAMQHLSVGWMEYDVIKKAIEKLDSTSE